MGERQANLTAQEQAGVQRFSLPLQRSRRTLLQQIEAFPRRRNALRKTRRQLSRPRQTRLRPNLDAIYEAVT